VKVSIADGATVTLDGVTIDGENYKDDDAKSYLKQNELVYPDSSLNYSHGDGTVLPL